MALGACGGLHIELAKEPSKVIDDNPDYTTITPHWRGRGWLAEWRRYSRITDDYQPHRIVDCLTRGEAETLAHQWAREYRLEYRS